MNKINVILNFSHRNKMKAVLIYDNSSPTCRRFIEQSESVFPLPVNKKKVYDRIKVSPYQIKEVPCILLFYPDGRIEKYEGEDGMRSIKSALEIKVTESEPQTIPGNERWTVPPKIDDPHDNRPDPEEVRARSKGFPDVSEVGEQHATTSFVIDKSLVEQMQKENARS
jgi:hypothetical protein